MWPIVLSDRLAVIALVSRYLTNKLIARSPLLEQKLALPFTLQGMPPGETIRY